MKFAKLSPTTTRLAVAALAVVGLSLRAGINAAAANDILPLVSSAPAAPIAANPAESLVGQRVTACNYNAELNIVVVSAEWTKVVVGEVAPRNMMWIVALIDVTNISNKPEALTTRPLQLRDGSGGVYDVQEDPPSADDVAEAYGVTPPWQDFYPGSTDRSVVTFLVPADAGPLTLVGKSDYC